MQAFAALRVECVWGRNRVTRLRSQAPLVLRATRLRHDERWVGASIGVPRMCLAAGAAGPVGGDRLTLQVDVGPGAAVVLSEISASLLLPGVHGDQSRFRTEITVASGGTLVWKPQPLIAAARCHHLNEISVRVEEDARFFMRDELLLGRHGEQPGRVTQDIDVRVGQRTLYRQRLDLGYGAPAWDSPVVAGANLALGSVLVVDPSFAAHPLAGAPIGATAAVLPLAGPAVVVTAVSPDSLALRRALAAGLAAVDAGPADVIR